MHAQTFFVVTNCTSTTTSVDHGGKRKTYKAVCSIIDLQASAGQGGVASLPTNLHSYTHSPLYVADLAIAAVTWIVLYLVRVHVHMHVGLAANSLLHILVFLLSIIGEIHQMLPT